VNRRCGGFSLIEVLVAFVILALTIGVLMRIFSGGLRNIGAAADYSRAVAIAESTLAAAGIETPLAVGETSGEAAPGYAWRMRIEPAAPADPAEPGATPPLQLYRVDVTVSFGDPRRPRSVRLTSLRVARS
jgi:general secretion pathway protein I